jgi:hypothetical protein
MRKHAQTASYDPTKKAIEVDAVSRNRRVVDRVLLSRLTGTPRPAFQGTRSGTFDKGSPNAFLCQATNSLTSGTRYPAHCIEGSAQCLDHLAPKPELSGNGNGDATDPPDGLTEWLRAFELLDLFLVPGHHFRAHDVGKP